MAWSAVNLVEVRGARMVTKKQRGSAAIFYSFGWTVRKPEKY